MSGFEEVTAVRTDLDAATGETVTYACEYLTSINEFAPIFIPAFYDLVYPCDASPEDAVDYIENALMDSAASTWGILPQGQACAFPTFVNSIWMVAISSLPQDELFDGLGCQSLVPQDGECCVVAKSNMTFIPNGDGADEQNLIAYVAQQLDSDRLTQGMDMPVTTSYIGSEMEYQPEQAKDDVPAAVNLGAAPQTIEGDNSFTVVGGFVLGGLVAALVGIMLILVRKRRQAKYSAEMDAALENSALSGAYDVSVLSESIATSSPKRSYSNSNIAPASPMTPGSPQSREEHTHVHTTTTFERSSDQSYPETSFRSSSYMFDLSRTFQQEVMGAYYGGGNNNNNNNNPTASGFYPPAPVARSRSGNNGNYPQVVSTANPQLVVGNSFGPTFMEVVPPYPMEETSDSEVDSWAQTDGTVGSLEERLDEITAEI